MLVRLDGDFGIIVCVKRHVLEGLRPALLAVRSIEIKGERIDEVVTARARELNIPVQDVEKEYVAKSSMKRMVTESEVASLVAFLASAESDGITGEAIGITAGYYL